jgi:PIN domain nuclease of toxin-antitoxin system
MIIKAVADTHALIWYVFNDARLSPFAATFMDEADADGERIGISSVTLVEIVYLIEKKRIDPTTFDRILTLLNLPDGVLWEFPVDRDIAKAVSLISRDEVPDMPDRIIAATAVHLGIPLISRDRKIQASKVATIW